MAYLIDSDVFIQAKNAHYGFDFCPAFWTWLATQHQAQAVYSVANVGAELTVGTDDLAAWAGQLGPGFFLPLGVETTNSLAALSTWAANEGYVPGALNRFFGAADYFLIGHAHAHGHTVVTHERAENTLKRVKIPTACNGLGVPCMTPFEMLRTERARFIV